MFVYTFYNPSDYTLLFSVHCALFICPAVECFSTSPTSLVLVPLVSGDVINVVVMTPVVANELTETSVCVMSSC